ncbi:hypothetical protein Alches_02660 [Alicyclobacillus hesperidum subsp. aegles]|nr:hypothetical protein Alches_02660 [Alicyclobacillus hesperidum subsp. aegles]
MYITIPHLRRVNSLHVAFDVFDRMDTRDTTYNTDNDCYWVDEPNEYKFYLLIVNQRFLLSDPLTSVYVALRNDVFATVERTIDTNHGVSIYSTICSRVDQLGYAAGETRLFSDENPIVILSFEIHSWDKKTHNAVVFVEWSYNNEPYWITSKPVRFSGSAVSHCALRLTKDVPAGEWTCSVYLGHDLHAVHNFSFVRNNMTALPTLFDSRV